MSPRKLSWGEGRYPRSSAKEPPPAHGIKLKQRQLGSTWWGKRWIEALEHVLAGDAGRLARGRSYARGGRTHDFHVARGAVTARVTGSRPQPYAVEISLAQISDAAWQLVIAVMAEKAQFAAELLAGRMPQDIEEAFRAVGSSLFPVARADLQTRCDCPDWGDPCKHVAAVHYVLGDALDRDPFLLFELRGRTQEWVLTELRAERGDVPAAVAPPGIKAGKLRAGDYDRPAGPPPVLALSFEAPSQTAALLKQLGTPTGWHGADAPATSLSPVVESAAAAARRIALADAAPALLPTPSAAPEAPAAPPPLRRKPGGAAKGAAKKQRPR